MSEKAKKNTIIVLEPSTKSTKELLGLIAEKKLADIMNASSPEEALQFLMASLPCMLIVGIPDNSFVPSRIQLFKNLERSVKFQGLKIYVVTPLNNRQLADLATQKMGVSDYIIEPMPVRTMMFKANLQLKALDNFRKQQELKRLADEQIVIKKLDGGTKTDAASGSDVKMSQKPALQLQEDTFLFKNSGVRKSGKKFTVELEGPDPSTGEWVQHEDKGDAQSAWRWVPNEEKEKQAKGEAPKDGWVHEGDKPQFSESSGKWAMTSEKPSLALKAKGQTVAQKLGVDEKGEVFVAEDSPAAEENLKKNRLKAAIKPKKEKAKSGLDGLLSDDDPEEKNGDVPAGASSQKPDQKNSKPGASPRKPGEPEGESSFENKIGKNENADGSPSAGVLHDRREAAEKDENHFLQDNRQKDGEEKKSDAFLGLTDDEAEESAPKTLSPLDFLKKKKEEKKKSPLLSLKDDPESEETDPQGASEDVAVAGKSLNRKKKGKAGTDDALARLKNSLKDDDTKSTAEEEQPGFLDKLDGSDEEEEEEGDNGLLSHKLKLKAAKKESALTEQLRNDPASKRAKVNDLQSLGPIKARGLRDQKKTALADIQALLDEPLPETLSPEKEEKLREELGLKGRPEIKPKDLARKKRLKDMKSLKERLGNLDLELEVAEEEEKRGETISADASEVGEPLKRRGDLARDKLQGIRQALDSDEAAAAEEEEIRRKKSGVEEEKAKKTALSDGYFYVPENELVPVGNAWEVSGDHYVYIDAKVRYKGFNKLDDLLPLWIFEGNEVPQLLGKTKQWRFLGKKPTQAHKVAEIPSEVRDFLIGLRDQLKHQTEGAAEAEKTGGKKEAIAEEESAGAGESALLNKKSKRKEKAKLPSLGKSIDELFSDDEEETEQADTASGEQNGGESEESGEETEEEKSVAKGKNKSKNNDDKIANLRAKLGMDEEAEGDAEADGSVTLASVNELIEENAESDNLAAPPPGKQRRSNEIPRTPEKEKNGGCPGWKEPTPSGSGSQSPGRSAGK